LDCEVWHKNWKDPSIAGCKAFSDLEPHQHYEFDRQTDGQTDFTIANAALHYVTWPETKTAVVATFLQFA